MNTEPNSTCAPLSATAASASETLSYFDLESEIHDAINMALLMDHRINDLFSDRSTLAKIDASEGALTIFLAGQVVEKAQAVLARWTEVHVSNGGLA